MRGFELISVKDLEQLLAYLDQAKRVKILAGGTDLLVELQKDSMQLAEINYLLDITHINELKEIREEDGVLVIGSLLTHTELINNPLLARRFPLLIRAARLIGSTQIRNRATIGGNIINASPAADLLPPLIALGAEVELRWREGCRQLSLAQCISGPYRTALRQNEVLTYIRIPVIPDSYYDSFQKIGRRRAVNIARINLALLMGISAEKHCYDARVVPGSVTPSPLRFQKTEQAINGQSLAGIKPDEIGQIAAEEMIQLSGERWSTPYKKPAVAKLLKKALLEIKGEVLANEN